MTDIPANAIAGLGEILWDMFPDGARFGGAPANYACHAAALAGASVMVSGVGQDELGRNAIEQLTGNRVRTSYVQVVDGSPTGAVQVQLDDQGHASYQFGTHEAWDQLSWTSSLAGLASQLSAVCFGTLGQRSAIARQTVQRFVGTTSAQCLRIFDVNLRPPYWARDVIDESLRLANVVKLNDEELPVVADIYGLSGSAEAQLLEMLTRFELHTVALTRGAAGAMLVRGGQVAECSGDATKVLDTVGAGDAFTAAMTVGLLQADDLEQVVQRSCQFAAYVCSQPGATPAIPQSLVDLVRRASS